MIVTKYGQVFYPEEADALVAQGMIAPCPALTGEEDHHDHDSSRCDYCNVYYDGPGLVKALRGLLEIAETAMPGSYFGTDRRILAAQAALKAAEEEA